MKQIKQPIEFSGIMAKTKPFIGEYLPFNGMTLPVFNIDSNKNVTCIAFDENGNEFLKIFKPEQIVQFYEN